jgi:hypothetical protein
MMKLFVLSVLAIIHVAMVVGKSCYNPAVTYNTTTNFFDGFYFETFNDPTNGYVDYVDEATGHSMGLIKYTENNQIYIGVDHDNVVKQDERGRKSIRLSSKQLLDGNNLVIIDLEHMPTTSGSTGMAKGCSVWPAFWTCGSDWPNNGEIDVIEYVNTDSIVATTLHTNAGCDQAAEDISTFSGHWTINPYGGANDNCDVSASDQYSNAGCSIQASVGSTVGDAFNNNGQKGGVYALEWDKDTEIRAFYFARNSIPSDITEGKPNPENWGKPYARFHLSSSICPSSHFHNHQIIFDNTFCGDWAGAVFPSTCSATVSCQSFVQNNPAEFTEAYWLINYVSVYNSC